jgi:hypothetical protein
VCRASTACVLQYLPGKDLAAQEMLLPKEAKEGRQRAKEVEARTIAKQHRLKGHKSK